MTVSTQLTFFACKSRETESSRLWSLKTGDDFARLVKQGRAVAEHSVLPLKTKGLPVSMDTSSFSGLKPIATEWDISNLAVSWMTFNTELTPPLSSDQLTAFSSEFIRTSENFLGVPFSEMHLANTPMSANAAWTTVHFERSISGVPVRDGRIDLTFATIDGKWHLADVQNRAWGKFSPTGNPQLQSLSASQLSSVTGLKNAKIIDSGIYYLPKHEGSKGIILQLANWYHIIDPLKNEYTLTFSGVSDPELIEAFSHRTEGLIQAESFKTNWSSAAKLFVPLIGASLISGGATSTIDDKGNAESVGSNAAIRLSGKIANVKKQGGAITQVPLKKNGTSWIADVNASNQPEVNAYAGIIKIREFAKQYLSDLETGYFRRTLEVTTQVSGKCNAYYQSRTLTFFQRNAGCADMATVNDVVMHEWGHGLDDHTGPGQLLGMGISDGAFSEGIGDAVSFLYSGEPQMGLGFYTDNPTKGIRSADNDLVYTGADLEVHKEGTIISGAFWELRRRMINKYGETVGPKRAAELFFKHLSFADNYKGSYKIVQRIADNDNNPATKHPDFCVINHAFAQKGLAPKDTCADGFNDANTIKPPQLNTDLYLALLGDGNSSPTFEASAVGGDIARIGLCRSANCDKPEILLDFKTLRGDRRIYTSSATLSFESGATIKIIALDNTGKVLSYRNVKFTKK